MVLHGLHSTLPYVIRFHEEMIEWGPEGVRVLSQAGQNQFWQLQGQVHTPQSMELQEQGLAKCNLG